MPVSKPLMVRNGIYGPTGLMNQPTMSLSAPMTPPITGPNSMLPDAMGTNENEIFRLGPKKITAKFKITVRAINIAATVNTLTFLQFSRDTLNDVIKFCTDFNSFFLICRNRIKRVSV